MSVTIHDVDRDIVLCVEVDPHGFVYVKAYVGDERLPELPRMTPFEASMLARDLSRAAEKADTV